MAISRYRVRFEKRDALRFISHHDLMRVFELALRRSGLKVAFTQGFNPHPRLSFALALPLGVESFDELVDIDLEHADLPPEPSLLVSVLGGQMPPGLRLLHAWLATGRPRVIAAEYQCDVGQEADLAGLRLRLEALHSAPSLPFSRSRGDGKSARKFDAKLFILSAALDGRVLSMRLRTGADGGMKPSDLLTLLDLDAGGILVTKTRTLLEDDLPETTQGPPAVQAPTEE